MPSILFDFYKPPDRPISQKELRSLNKKNFKNMNLSNFETYHNNTGFFYLVKRNGKKEKEMLKLKNNNPCTMFENIGSCSVTWKLKNTPEKYKKRAENIVQEYCKIFKSKPLCNHDSFLTHYEVELTRVFYVWLYYERYDSESDQESIEQELIEKEQNN